LVVEDGADVRTLAVVLMSDLGYNVFKAGDGPAAMSILERERHTDLLFTDVILPSGMNGEAIADAAPAITRTSRSYTCPASLRTR
jgi:CheY-like chemotaxis protein